jgi:outer membrane receptor protein involved in Fe transport
MKFQMTPVTQGTPVRASQPWRAIAGLVLALGLAEGPTMAAALPQTANATSPPRQGIDGVVRDASGAPVAGANVLLRTATGELRTQTDNQGHFAFPVVAARSGVLEVDAAGLARVKEKWTAAAGESSLHLEVRLTPATLLQRITVTATGTRERIGDTAATVTVLQRSTLLSTAALELDDALRQVPGFSLLRRSGSRVANPTAQGVSLRGTGASGASRAVVLEDGIPLNDPFGGWVYWDRVPRESLDRIEVLEGGASDLYGTGALGGVVNLIPQRPVASTLSLETSYGNESTPDASVSASLRAGSWMSTLDASGFRTDGYVLVAPAVRGAVDTRAASENRFGRVTLAKIFSEQARAFLRGSFFQEARHNGTPLQTNRTHLRQVAAGGDWQSAAGVFSLRAYGGPQVFDQNFSAIAAGRSSETLTDVQRVPAQELGFSAQWSRPAGAMQTLVAGLAASAVRGSSNELLYRAGLLNSALGAGGRQRNLGLFGEDLIRLTPRWIITAAARFDDWHNDRALSTSTPLAAPGPATVIVFPDRGEHAFSPRLSVLHRLNGRASLYASGYRAFRAPTLNELYRRFRVGNVLTLANSALEAERLTGGEAGAKFSLVGQRLSARTDFFWADITRPVANVTLSVTPNLIIRQRENLGRTRARGVEAQMEAQVTRSLLLAAGYQFADATVTSFPANPALVGLLVPLVPRHDFTFQTRYSGPHQLTLAAQGRAEGAEFDDDLNQLRLNPYFTLDVFVSRGFTLRGQAVELFAAGENVLNQRYDVGRTPVRTLGPPALARVGIRLSLPPR